MRSLILIIDHYNLPLIFQLNKRGFLSVQTSFNPKKLFVVHFQYEKYRPFLHYYQTFYYMSLIYLYYMNLWSVAVFELDSHPDRNKGPDYAPCAFQ